MIINHIEDIWPFVKDQDEIIRIEKEGYTVLDYVYQDEHTFDVPQAMECRGIKFNSDGTILARPFAKFFNYGERDTDLPIEFPHVVMEKLDGSMIHPAMVHGEILLMTRKGHTKVAKKAEGYFLRRPAYFDFMNDWMHRGYTPIFEFIGPTNRIVLRYETHRLVLVAMRQIVQGEYLSYNIMKENAGKYGVEVVNCEILGSIGNVEDFIEHTKELVDLEGYVVSFDHGLRVKIKALDYLVKHRALDDMSSKKKVVALCVQGFADDIMPVLDDAGKQELARFRHSLNVYADRKVKVAENFASEYASARKDFAILVAPNMTRHSWLAGVVFGIMDGKPARPAVLKAMQKHWKELPVTWRGA